MSSAHATVVPDGLSCACCWDDISASNYVEYLPYPHEENNHNPTWQASKFCEMCVEVLLSSQWSTYVNALQSTKCKAEQRRLLTVGPPINIKDKNALPCPNDGEVNLLWYMSTQDEKSGKLKDSLTGAARDAYWKEQMQFYVIDEPEDTKTDAETNQ
jgi:hypothetical protein